MPSEDKDSIKPEDIENILHDQNDGEEDDSDGEYLTFDPAPSDSSKIDANKFQTSSPKTVEEEMAGMPKEAPLIVRPINAVSGDSVSIKNMLDQMVSLDNKNEISEPTCPICLHQNRLKIEQAYKEANTLEKIDKVMGMMGGSSKISSEIINNHMSYHANRGVRELQKREFINRISRLNNISLTSLDRIDLAISQIEDRIIEINSVVPVGDYNHADIEKLKSSETSKLLSTKAKYLQMRIGILGEMKISGELMSFYSSDFTSTFSDILKKAKTQNELALIKELAQRLKDIRRNT
jgi:hypothetical protein